MVFSDTFLRQLKPKKGPYRVFEKANTKGFGVQVMPNGNITFFLCYAAEGKTKYSTLAKYPALSITEARKLANLRRAEVEANVSTDGRPKAGTIEQLLTLYIAQKKAEGRRSVSEIERTLYKDALPLLKGKLARDVTPQDIRAVLHALIARDAKVASNRLRSYLRSAFQFGIRYDHDPATMGKGALFHLEMNPVDPVPNNRTAEKQGERVLTLEELRQVWNRKPDDAFSLRYHYLFRLILLFTGLRPGEVSRAKIAEVDFQQRLWNIPPDRTKNARWHVLPLTDLTHKMFFDLAGYALGSEYFFPGRDDPGKPEYETSFQHAVARLCRVDGMTPWAPRDLRRTAKTWAGHAGLEKEIRDRLLNHALTDVSARHYDRYLYLKEKSEALERWEGFLLKEMAP